VHRELKPSNIMVQTGMSIAEGVKILDFGLAKIKSGKLLGSFVQAQTSGLMGSSFYMAPEQWSDEEPDSRADVYSLGIILYQMLSGDVPFKGSSIPSIMKKHLTLPPPRFRSVGVDVSPRVEAVVFHALEKELYARPLTVEAFVAELREAVASEGSTMLRQTPPSDLRENFPAQSSNTDAMTKPMPNYPPDSLAGTVSSPTLSQEEQEEISALRLARARKQEEEVRLARIEREEKERLAKEKLWREAYARRDAAKEVERKGKEEEEQVTREKAEREERERQQREQIKRVERQARELEERLARLSTSMPPAASVVDLESTQTHQGLRTAHVSQDSLSGVDSAAGFHVSIASKPKSSLAGVIVRLPLVIAALPFVIGGAVVEEIKGRTRASRAKKPPLAKTPIYLDENVQFTVYKPKKVRPQKWYPLLAYAHLSERRPGQDEADPIEQMQLQAKRILGEQNLKDYSRATEDSSQAIPRQGQITFVPFIPGVVFDPPSRSCFWLKSVHGQEFRMMASADLDGKTARGQMSVFLGSILLAEINISLPVDSTQVRTDEPLEREMPAPPYRKIFPSYSHKDREIVAQIAHYAEVTGDKYMLDISELRSGQNWKKWMQEKIEEADIFQLFWSTNSMRSQNVRLEWQLALSLGKQDFIRPTYWENPLPQSIAENLPPPELLDLHFQQVQVPARMSFAPGLWFIMIALGIVGLIIGLLIVFLLVAR
jgi:flagellar biosynthesis GTPase FlhF